MAEFRVKIPVTLELKVHAEDADKALMLIQRAFEHKAPIGGMPVINLILKRGEYCRADLIDAVPTDEPLLVLSQGVEP